MIILTPGFKGKVRYKKRPPAFFETSNLWSILVIGKKIGVDEK